MKAQEWIDRYVHAVGGALPTDERADVEAEIRSLIQDELEARGVIDLTAADEQAVLGVLAQFGRPATLAAHYHAPRSLIGPVLYPTFRIVATIVLMVLAGVWIFGIAINLGMGQRTISNPVELIGGLVGGLFQTFGTLVFVFALIETFSRGRLETEEKEKLWDPRSLPKIEQTERVKVGDLVVGIGFSLAAIVIFNAYPEWVSVMTIVDGQVASTPVLSENFLAFVPWLTILWVLTIALNTYVLAQGRWQPITRWLQIGLSILALVILGWMLASGSLLAWTALEPVANLVVAVIFAVTAIDIVVQIYRLMRRQFAVSGNAGETPSRLR